MIDPDNRAADARISPDTVAKLDRGDPVVVTQKPDRIEAATRLPGRPKVYVYASREANMLGLRQFDRARTVLADYNGLFERSQQLQLQFNGALYLGSLLLLALAVIAAIVVADRIVRPLGTLIGATRTAAGGDLSVRVTPPARDWLVCNPPVHLVMFRGRYRGSWRTGAKGDLLWRVRSPGGGGQGQQVSPRW